MPNKKLPPIEELLALKDDGWTHSEIEQFHGASKGAVAKTLYRHRASTDSLIGRTPYTGVPFRVPPHLAGRHIWRMLVANEKRNLGVPNTPRMEGQLDRWRHRMTGRVVGFDLSLEPEGEHFTEGIFRSIDGKGYFFATTRVQGDPEPEDPMKPMFITLRDKYGRFRTWEEVRGLPSDINLRGL